MRVLLPIIYHELTECIERAFKEEGHEVMVVNWRVNAKGASIYAQLITSSHPWPRHMAASAARASQDTPSPKFIYHVDPPRKWWQFWKR